MYAVWNGAIFNNLERPVTQILRLRRYLTVNISETAKDTAIVAIECEWETVPELSNNTFFNYLD